MKRRMVGTASLGVASLVTLTLAIPAAASGGNVINLSKGHVDGIDVAYENGELELSVHDEENDVELDPATVRLIALPGSAVEVPDDPDCDYGFLGDPGDTVWVLPEVQDENLLWLGLSAEEIELGVFQNDALTVHIKGVTGPGGFSIFDTGQDGCANILADSEDGLPDRIAIGAGIHKHVSWGFEAPGTYRVEYRVSGRLEASGERVRSDLVTLTFKVRS